MSDQLLDLAALLLMYETGYSLNRRSDVPQGKSGRFGQDIILLYFLRKPTKYYIHAEYTAFVKIRNETRTNG